MLWSAVRFSFGKKANYNYSKINSEKYFGNLILEFKAFPWLMFRELGLDHLRELWTLFLPKKSKLIHQLINWNKFCHFLAYMNTILNEIKRQAPSLITFSIKKNLSCQHFSINPKDTFEVNIHEQSLPELEVDPWAKLGRIADPIQS